MYAKSNGSIYITDLIISSEKFKRDRHYIMKIKFKHPISTKRRITSDLNSLNIVNYEKKVLKSDW